MYQLSDIVALDIELSSLCNAACPMCPRNFHSYPENRGYPEHNMTLDEAQRILRPDFLRQLKSIWINGNFGDMLMNPDTVDIIKYIKQHSSADIAISTNGGARHREFWQDLAKLNVTVHFCIDGLEDTHSIYRQNTLYSVVMANARAFIAAGGRAVWKMVHFEHNAHQIAQAKKLAKQLGFIYHNLIDHGRNNSPVFNKQKQLIYVIGKVPYPDFEILQNARVTQEVTFPMQPTTAITCKAQVKKELYISSTGDVYPCCFTGFHPDTFERGMNTYYSLINQELAPLVRNNNALQHSLEECVNWFNSIPPTWNSTPLRVCNDACGTNSPYTASPT
jgi:MoaA/NifB/PqqE/SkfB family radical SAM enzyme